MARVERYPNWEELSPELSGLSDEVSSDLMYFNRAQESAIRHIIGDGEQPDGYLLRGTAPRAITSRDLLMYSHIKQWGYGVCVNEIGEPPDDPGPMLRAVQIHVLREDAVPVEQLMREHAPAYDPLLYRLNYSSITPSTWLPHESEGPFAKQAYLTAVLVRLGRIGLPREGLETYTQLREQKIKPLGPEEISGLVVATLEAKLALLPDLQRPAAA